MPVRNVASEDVSLVITCHPEPSSLCGHLATQVISALEARKATIVVNDLYQLDFSPVLSGDEFASYFDDPVPADIHGLVADLRSADELIFILPIWMFAMPAILKGYFDRVWRPHVAFSFDGKNLQPMLTHIRRMTVIVTHGRSEAETNATGDGTREFFATSLPTLLPNLKRNNRFDFYALDEPDATAVDSRIAQLLAHMAD